MSEFVDLQGDILALVSPVIYEQWDVSRYNIVPWTDHQPASNFSSSLCLSSSLTPNIIVGIKKQFSRQFHQPGGW